MRERPGGRGGDASPGRLQSVAAPAGPTHRRHAPRGHAHLLPHRRPVRAEPAGPWLVPARRDGSCVTGELWINWFHLPLGAVVVGVRHSRSPRLQNTTTRVAAGMATTIGPAGLAFGPAAAKRYDVPELADPSDHLAHL